MKDDLGRWGEGKAVKYLAAKGYRILQTNWRCGKAEIDIIAQEGPLFIFVEVKTRSGVVYGEPEDAVGPKKIQMMSRAATAYLENIPDDRAEIRFDIISVTGNARHFNINHIEDAFWPGYHLS